MQVLFLNCLLIFFELCISQTQVSIKGEKFYINGKLTYPLTSNENVGGLLFNARMINGIFDDYNKSTVNLWAYPDTKGYALVNSQFVA